MHSYTSMHHTVKESQVIRKSLSLITPLYQWMQLSVACLVPYFSVLFHSYSLLNIAVAHQTFDIATSALLIKLDICCIPNLDRATAYCNQPCSSNSKAMQDGTHKHQTVLLVSMLAGCHNSQMCKTFVHVWSFIIDCVPARHRPYILQDLKTLKM